jgi:hypothetical protein
LFDQQETTGAARTLRDTQMVSDSAFICSYDNCMPFHTPYSESFLCLRIFLQWYLASVVKKTRRRKEPQSKQCSLTLYSSYIDGLGIEVKRELERNQQREIETPNRLPKRQEKKITWTGEEPGSTTNNRTVRLSINYDPRNEQCRAMCATKLTKLGERTPQ